MSSLTLCPIGKQRRFKNESFSVMIGTMGRLRRAGIGNTVRVFQAALVEVSATILSASASNATRLSRTRSHRRHTSALTMPRCDSKLSSPIVYRTPSSGQVTPRLAARSRERVVLPVPALPGMATRIPESRACVMLDRIGGHDTLDKDSFFSRADAFALRSRGPCFQ